MGEHRGNFHDLRRGCLSINPKRLNKPLVTRAEAIREAVRSLETNLHDLDGSANTLDPRFYEWALWAAISLIDDIPLGRYLRRVPEI